MLSKNYVNDLLVNHQKVYCCQKREPKIGTLRIHTLSMLHHCWSLAMKEFDIFGGKYIQKWLHIILTPPIEADLQTEEYGD